jgi:hypothetical protein
MDRLLNALKGQGANQDQAAGAPRFGLVTSVDPATATARVTLQPEGVLTGWLPLLTPWVGNGWGLVCPPSPGDQVLVIPQEGDAEHGLFIKLQNDGTIQIKGDLPVSGDVYDTHGPMSGLRGHYNAHVHPPQNSQTSQPD